MSQSISELLGKLAKAESAEGLSSRLSPIGIEADLNALPGTQVSAEFRTLTDTFLRKPLSEITLGELSALTKEVEKLDTALESTACTHSISKEVYHNIYAYRVVVPETTHSQESYLIESLGREAGAVIDGLKALGIDLSKSIAPRLNVATLDLRSCGMWPDQQNSLYEKGLVDPLQGTNIVVDAFCVAKKAGLNLSNENGESFIEKGDRVEAEALTKGLNPATATLLKILTSGFLRVGGGSGAIGFDIDSCGSVRVGLREGISPAYFALGG